jgi:tetratricopeptide (TPR) repeat protein
MPQPLPDRQRTALHTSGPLPTVNDGRAVTPPTHHEENERMSREWMSRRIGRVAMLAWLAVAGLTVAGCSQFGGLKAQKHFKDANALYQQQDYRKAAAEYEGAVKANPDLNAAYFYLGNCYDNLYKVARRGESVNDSYLDEAVKNYQLSIERLASATDEPSKQLRKRSMQYLAAVYATDKKNEPEKAEPVVKQLIAMDPKDTSNYVGLAKIYEDAGQVDKAEEVLKQAEAAAPNDVGIITQLAEFYNRKGDAFETAMSKYEQVTTLEPTNPQTFYNVALRYEEVVRKDYRLNAAKKGEYLKKGVEAIDKALAIRPDYFEALTYKNLLLRQQALLERNGSPKQKQLIEEADRLRNRAIEVQNVKAKGVGA